MQLVCSTKKTVCRWFLLRMRDRHILRHGCCCGRLGRAGRRRQRRRRGSRHPPSPTRDNITTTNTTNTNTNTTTAATTTTASTSTTTAATTSSSVSSAGKSEGSSGRDLLLRLRTLGLHGSRMKHPRQERREEGDVRIGARNRNRSGLAICSNQQQATRTDSCQ